MALLKTKNSEFIETRSILKMGIDPPMIEGNGLSMLQAFISTEDRKSVVTLLRAPEAQVKEISDQIAEKWFENELFVIPNARPLTLDEEKNLWNSIWTDERRNIHIYIKPDGTTVVRFKDEGDNIKTFSTIYSDAYKDLDAYLESIDIPDVKRDQIAERIEKSYK